MRYKVESVIQVSKSGKGLYTTINGVGVWLPNNHVEITGKDIIRTEDKIYQAEFIDVPDWLDKKMEKAGAQFSDDKKHRYFLWRIWNSTKKTALCIGLNPSTANEAKNDPTIYRLRTTLNTLGYGGLVMVNLFSVISSDPAVLSNYIDSDESRKTDMGMIFGQALNCQDIIFCWGAFKEARDRAQRVIDFFENGKCFGKNKDGSPWHPQAMMYAGFKPNSERLPLFEYRTHSFGKNWYKSKKRTVKADVEREQTNLTLGI